MKQFWKDYGELCKETGRFYKKHWKGCVLLNAAIIGAELMWFKCQKKQFENYEKSVEDEEAQ